MTARLVTAVEHPVVDILGHCTGRIVVGRGRPPSTFDTERVFTAAAAAGTAIEVNSRPERLDPPRPMLRQAIELGCDIAIDADTPHAPGQLSWQPFGCERVAECEVPLDRVINALPLEDCSPAHIPLDAHGRIADGDIGRDNARPDSTARGARCRSICCRSRTRRKASKVC